MMKKFFFGFLVAVVLVVGAIATFMAVEPEPTLADENDEDIDTRCSISDPDLRKWRCPRGTVCGQRYGDCLGI